MRSRAAKKKTLSLSILTLLLAAAFAAAFLSVNIPPARAQTRTWTVDDDGVADFHTIQEAINLAATGDIIRVNWGVYQENVVVNKTISLLGEVGLQHPLIFGDGNASVVEIAANGVTIQGFNITNGGYGSSYGDGMLGGGIEVFDASNCVIADNNAYINGACGISLVNANYNNVTNNTCVGNWVGINLWSWAPKTASNNIIINNTCLQNSKSGIYLWSYVYLTWTTNSNTIANNNCSQNGDGVFIGKSKLDSVSGNTLRANSYGITLQSSSNNSFFHNNLIENAKQVFVWDLDEGSSLNSWDAGYPLGGNYWSNYTGIDANSDGIGDTPYVIDDSNQDLYPLMAPFGTQPSTVQPTASLSAQPNPAGVGQTVQITLLIVPPPPTPGNFSGLLLRITRPDGTMETKGPYLSNANGSAFTMYTPTMVGNYTLKLNYTGQFFATINATYLPASSTSVTLRVQQQPVSSGSPSPTPTATPRPLPPTPTPSPYPTNTPIPTSTPTPTPKPTPTPTFILQQGVQPTQKPSFPILTVAAIAVAVIIIAVAGIMLWKYQSKAKPRT